LDREESGILKAIPGNPPDLVELPRGCPFRPRCPHAFDRCVEHPPLEDAGEGHLKRCWLESLPDTHEHEER
jgi:oligopeptide/dipeptide ABC transporter ATP-binding protein